MRRGFTLPELLVSCTILSGLALMLVLYFNQVVGAVDQGVGRVDLQRKAREALTRVSPYLASANGLGSQVTGPVPARLLRCCPSRPPVCWRWC